MRSKWLIALFKRQQRRIANEDRCIGALQHRVKIGRHGHKRNLRIAPFVKHHARVGKRRRLAVSAATERSLLGDCLARCTRISERTLPFEAIVHPGRIRSPGVVAREAMGISPMSARPSASRAAHSAGVMRSSDVAFCQRLIERRMFKVPHQRRGIEKSNRRNPQTRVLLVLHIS